MKDIETLSTLADEKARKKYEEMLASLGTGVIGVDTRLRVLSINKFALKFFHKRKSSAAGDFYWHFFKVRNEKGKMGKDTVRLALRKVVRKGKTSKKVKPEVFPRVFVRLPKEGLKPISVNIAPVYNSNKTLTGAVISFRDVAEEAEVDKMKNEVVSLAAHQLRAPMTSIRWNVEMLLRDEVGKVPDNQKELLQDVYDSNTRMLKLINDLLNIARLEEGRVRVEPVAIDLKQAVQKVIHEYAPQAKDKSCSVELISGKGVSARPIVKVDPGLVHEAIKNYLTNAIKYGKGESCAITVMIEKGVRDYKISVHDNGIGIPAKEKKKVFQKFFRTDDAGALDPLGSGLGLYIVRMIAKLSGGRVGFNSGKGGTTFYLTIPLKGSKVNKKGKQFSHLNL